MARAATFGPGGGWVMDPPVSRGEAEVEFGAAITDDAWREVRAAFKRHGSRLDDLEGTRLNKNPNDQQGWHRRKSDAERNLNAAEKALAAINLDFLREAEELASLKQSGGRDSYESQQRLKTALDEVAFLSWILREAEPIQRELPSEAESRRILACDVFKALERLGAELSNGWSLAQIDQPSHADLTGYERLAELLQIHQGETPAATAKWLREALAQKR